MDVHCARVIVGYAISDNLPTIRLSGVANMIWSWGQLRRRHGDAFAVRTDVLSALTVLVSRMPSAFAVQGLSCSAMGCANLGVPLRAAAAPLMRVLIAECTQRAETEFNMQAMANTASAVVRMGGADVLGTAAVPALLRAFDRRATRLPPPYKPTELSALAAAMLRCSVRPTAFCLVQTLASSSPECNNVPALQGVDRSGSPAVASCQPPMFVMGTSSDSWPSSSSSSQLPIGSSDTSLFSHDALGRSDPILTLRNSCSSRSPSENGFLAHSSEGSFSVEHSSMHGTTTGVGSLQQVLCNDVASSVGVQLATTLFEFDISHLLPEHPFCIASDAPKQ